MANNYLNTFKENILPEPKHDFIVSEVGIVINGQDGLSLHYIPRQEAIVQTVLLCPHHLQTITRRLRISLPECHICICGGVPFI